MCCSDGANDNHTRGKAHIHDPMCCSDGANDDHTMGESHIHTRPYVLHRWTDLRTSRTRPTWPHVAVRNPAQFINMEPPLGFQRPNPDGKCAIDDFLDGAPQFRHSSMPCLSRGQARAMPIVRNCSCICEQPVTILTQKGLPFNTKTRVDLSVQNAPPSDAKECLTS